ncbi:glycosyltransferase [Litorivicinus lipolyticus]|uniref:Glycosyltransferase n=1 Tax=Litorivicinus lipolyticus TaxID=418701 RepID=A0A5Q2QB98_9GAMM|nr:glycosyltransferase [Litorivicinus lipolyticus]QGG79090.1 glycosyltransferase [Litorivicinus lipolyticus]
MKVCLVSNHTHPVKLYGGTERVVEWLAEKLSLFGHHVVLVAQPGSDLPGIEVRHATDSKTAQALTLDADIVHYHGWLPDDLNPQKPYLYTLHGNEPDISLLPSITCCISQNHATRHQRTLFAYNGVDPDELDFSSRPDDHLLFFSKIRRRNKGARSAVDLCHAYNQKLTMAGGSRLDLIKVGVFWRSIFDGVTIRGEIGGAQKAQEFRAAKALLFPINWQEPFGLVLIEAMMSGTPVIASRYGSTPELVAREAGAIYDDPHGFVDALEHAVNLNRITVRDYAITNFSASLMAQTYIRIYEQILDGTPPHQLVGSRLITP